MAPLRLFPVESSLLVVQPVPLTLTLNPGALVQHDSLPATRLKRLTGRMKNFHKLFNFGIGIAKLRSHTVVPDRHHPTLVEANRPDNNRMRSVLSGGEREVACGELHDCSRG